MMMMLARYVLIHDSISIARDVPYAIESRRRRHHQEYHQRNEKISNKSSFGIRDIAEHSSTSDRIIVIVEMACFSHDGAYRWRSGRHVNVPASH